ncbi:hypothetical protein [Streptomyces boninensis]|uniref:hypothetical protein n=1 Tax=Streptomyces boninensis TaxID=2039455 RepID=UPI003B2232B6
MATTKRAPGVDPGTAVEQLRDALTGVDIVLPSLAIDTTSPRLALVQLGTVRAEVAMQLAGALRDRGGDSDG